MTNVILKRNLPGSGYRWEMIGNRVYLKDIKNNSGVELTKVAAMSLMKFLPNYLDKMRIEDNKSLRLQMAKMREVAKAKREQMKMKKQQQQLFAKARNVKHE